MMVEKLLTTREVADRLGVDTKTILRYLKAGRLKGAKLANEYRIPESSVQSLLGAGPRPVASVDTAVITAIVNQKGGVGKTTTAFNLGVGLQRLGKRVLLVDLDPQAALTVSAGISLPHVTVSIYQALLDDAVDPASVIRETASGVDVLPATLDLAAAEVELVSMTLRELVLKDVLSKIQHRYDHILIDCPPSLGLLTINALAAAHQVIIPLQCEFLATRGLNLLLRTLTKIQGRLNRDLKVAGILPTMFDGRTTNANEILAELRTTFPGQVYDMVVKNTVRLKESPAAGLSILDYDRHHEAAQAYLALAGEVARG
jgi:chromosome partitioning protein